MCSVGAEPLYPGLPVWWDWRLCLAVENGCEFAPFLEQTHRIVPMASKAIGLGIQIRQKCQLSPLARWVHRLSFIDGQSHWLGNAQVLLKAGIQSAMI